MKGFSLSVETVVVIIIASVILGVLILFFKGTSNPAIDEIKLEQHLSKLCSDYQVLDPGCSGQATNKESADKIRQEIESACRKLNIPIHRENNNAVELIHDCCKFVCP